MNATILIENLDLTEAEIDSANRTVRQVLIREGMSKNRRRYDGKVLEAAAPLFNNIRTYANHPSKSDLKDRPERSVRELTGWISEVTYENGAIIGTRHFARTQAGQDTWAIVEDIVQGKAPASLIGASINAVGKGQQSKDSQGDFLEVLSIESVHSCDDVTLAAAGGEFLPLMASAGDEITHQLIASMTYEEWLSARHEFVEKLKREWKQVRLEQATRDALTEADQKVKAVEAKAATAVQAETAAQEQVTRLQTAIEKLAADNTALRLDKAVHEALDGVQLPSVYLEDLRRELPRLPATEWSAKIDTEIAKAKRASTPKVTVTGAGAVQHTAVMQTAVVNTTESLLPRDDEDIAAWKARLAHMKG